MMAKSGKKKANIFVRWLATALAIWLAYRLIPGIVPLDNSLMTLLGTALIFGLVNALLRPVAITLTCPLLVLTLGLGTLLINAGMFALTGWIGQQFGVGFIVEGFWPAFWGALLVSVVSGILSSLLADDD